MSENNKQRIDEIVDKLEDIVATNEIMEIFSERIRQNHERFLTNDSESEQIQYLVYNNQIDFAMADVIREALEKIDGMLNTCIENLMAIE